MVLRQEICWHQHRQEYFDSTPYNFTVIDQLVDPKFIEPLRRQLLSHYGWRHKNWISDHLHNNEPRGDLIDRLVDDLNRRVAPVFTGCELMSHWALMYRNNEQSRFHSDDAIATLTFWLTNDKFNLDKQSGGLLLSPRKRDANMRSADFLDAGIAEACIEGVSSKAFRRIKYRQNRAVLFDSYNFHRTDRLLFDTSTPDGFRLSITFAFDNHAEFARRTKA